ncbi:hypothetical protein GGI04_003726, partial [Coemansia thaxteri]
QIQYYNSNSIPAPTSAFTMPTIFAFIYSKESVSGRYARYTSDNTYYAIEVDNMNVTLEDVMKKLSQKNSKYSYSTHILTTTKFTGANAVNSSGTLAGNWVKNGGNVYVCPK